MRKGPEPFGVRALPLQSLNQNPVDEEPRSAMTTDDRQDPAERKSTDRTGDEPGRNYPLPRSDDDHRFTDGLMIDLVRVLREHGYPELTGLDLADFFHIRVFGFLYGARTPDTAVELVRSGALVLPGPDPVDESRPVTPRPEFDRDGYPVPTRRCAGVNAAGTPFFGDHIGCEHDPARRFDRLQADPRPDTTEPPPWDSAEPAVMPWDEAEIPQPPACPVHDWNALNCRACGDLRREFYLYIARKMAASADEVGPCAGGRCIDPEAHAEGAHDQ